MAEDPYEPGSHATGQWHTAPQQQYADPYASAYYGTGTYDTGTYDTTGAWATGGYEQVADIPAQHPRTMAEQHATGQWDTSAYETQMYAAQHPDTQSFDTHSFEPQSFEPQSFETQSFQTPGFETQSFEFQGFEAQHFEAQGFETQSFETPSFNTHDMLGAPDPHDTQGSTHTFQAPVFGTTAYDTGAYDATQWNAADAVAPAEPEAEDEPVMDPAPEAEHPHGPALDADPAPPQPTSRRAGKNAKNVSRGRAGRRRPPAKRSALVTIVVPSVCVVGVAGIAAASVGGSSGDDGKEAQAEAAPDAQAVKPAVANNKLDSQLKDLSADAGDFADRASRTQERIDLKAKQEAARKHAAEEAARKEAARPKFVLPVKQHGLSAFFGQAGVNWMSQHSGIDFPVSYGTPVMAATDGTVKTQWNSAYGNMAIVTAKDGTETWYCHLSSHTVMSGPVKAGDVIARSGNSGNSTGPHLHFEVRPGGSAAIDPLPWLRSHGLNPN
ncbi:M23 family metallopeptidase [Streptomyces sp. NPDC002790]|uniref:M23 family metallopeptidase n=1 Tax=Streptomyces sp. NPDC002790 TaxID=3154431 RepID=UPI00331E5690